MQAVKRKCHSQGSNSRPLKKSLNTLPTELGCFGVRNLESVVYKRKRVMILEFQITVNACPRIVMDGRIRTRRSATHASLVSVPVNFAGALAPVVFSGQPKLQTCKITKINGKGIPYPPNSTIANSMVVLVLPESS